MFTGIVEERGTVRSTDRHRLEIACSRVVEDVGVDDSIAVNGVCLTVVGRSGDVLSFDLTPETLARSSLGLLRPGDAVNLERPVTLSTRLGGHLVQGHVDGVGEVVSLEPNEAGATLTVRPPHQLNRYLVEKGSVALDGVSLTIAGISDGTIEVALIPHTIATTTLGAVAPGDVVNVEVDLMARYVERLMGANT